MPNLSRRKPFKYKQNKTAKTAKSSRTKLTAVQRAFIEQKNAIINITTSCRNNREKESWQAIRDSDFDDIIPRMSISTFENVMYKACFTPRIGEERGMQRVWCKDRERYNNNVKKDYNRKACYL
ncbi:hypothetical protein CC86DRAFT_382166 [Ophiobolus disseminans]|uniref:Uncharacterized protein n=1 Tax=Ophiobolus disseminans TaxID=1469910 RepID=A0A6A7A358_9PLEO|nr:hypothetical protein CC86DRAFT_382166 [Ophiobolus disseminans]